MRGSTEDALHLANFSLLLAAQFCCAVAWRTTRVFWDDHVSRYVWGAVVIVERNRTFKNTLPDNVHFKGFLQHALSRVICVKQNWNEISCNKCQIFRRRDDLIWWSKLKRTVKKCFLGIVRYAKKSSTESYWNGYPIFYFVKLSDQTRPVKIKTRANSFVLEISIRFLHCHFGRSISQDSNMTAVDDYSDILDVFTTNCLSWKS